MIVTTNSTSKNFAVAQTNNPPRVWATNAFSMTLPFDDVVPSKEDLPEKDGKRYLCLNDKKVRAFDPVFEKWAVIDENPDHITWDITDPIRPKLTIKMTKGGDNTSFARSFACQAVTLYGRWETVGQVAPIDGERVPKILDFSIEAKEPGQFGAEIYKERGQDGMKTPMFDLEWVADRTGYPAKATAMPRTTVHCQTVIPADMIANTLADIYFNWMPDGDGMNTHISANASRHLNLQVQCNRGKAINPEAHAGGMSGGKRLDLYPSIGGIEWDVAYKHETHNGNSFPLLSFAPRNGLPAHRFYADDLVNWLLANWDEIEAACLSYSCDLFDVTIDTLRAAYIDSVHLGNECLGYCDGTIDYEKFYVEIEPADESEKDFSGAPIDAVKHTNPGRGEHLSTNVIDATPDNSEDAETGKKHQSPNQCQCPNCGSTLAMIVLKRA